MWGCNKAFRVSLFEFRIFTNQSMWRRYSQNSEFKGWHLAVLLLVALSALGYRLYASVWPQATIRLGGRELLVLVADTVSRRYRGLSQRDSLGKYGGMLFIFPARGAHPMVMRQMRWPLDIIWIDNGQIVDMALNVWPEPGKPEGELTPYASRLPATMVLELPAGFIGERRLSIGDAVEVSR